MKTIRIALSFSLAVAAAAPAQTNVAEHFSGTSATIANTLSLAGGDPRGSGAFAHGYSVATGEYSVALGFGAMSLHDRSFVWADSTNPPVFSTGPGQFIVHATNGIYLLGGKIYGNASELTDISASAISGLGSAALLPAGAFATAAEGQTAHAAFDTANSALQADGRVAWTGTQDAAFRTLTNVGAAFASAVVLQTNTASTSVIVGLRVSPIEGYGAPPPACGDYYGSVESGFACTDTIVTADGFTTGATLTRAGNGQWTLAWTEDTRAVITQLWDVATGTGSFWYPRYGVQIDTLVDDPVSPTSVAICGGPWGWSYVFYGDAATGFYHSDGNKCFFADANGWWFQHVFPDRHTAFATGDLPEGNHTNVGSLQAMTYSFNISIISREVPTTEILSVTNPVPFEVADGRHAWVGNHNAGGFNLHDVGTLRAQAVVGDGSGLANVGLAALDVASIDVRYLLKSGDTVSGDLEVNGALTVDGRPVATLTRVPPQGDISMGVFTNVPPQP